MARTTAFETLNGFPRETITLANWRTRPYSFWSFRNIAEMVRSARITTATPRRLPDQMENPVLFSQPLAPGADESLGEFLRRAETDSFLVARDGYLLGEWHAPGVDRDDPHLVFSISKSITALVAGILQDQGSINVSTPVGELVPEATGSAYADATVLDLLDMRVSLDFDESYLSQEEYARYRRATSWNPPNSDDGEDGMLAFLCSLAKAAGPHGGDHAYLSPNSDMLGIVLERASGGRFTDLCARLLWQPLGASADAFVTVDRKGAARTAGGISVRPHDLLALGQMLLDGGKANGRQVVSERWIEDMRENGDPGVWARGAQAYFLKGGRYRSNWYQVGGSSKAFLAAGIHGQFLYCDPETGTAIVCTSSQNEPQNDALDQAMLRLFAKLCKTA